VNSLKKPGEDSQYNRQSFALERIFCLGTELPAAAQLESP
jgi:hypothetical protein